MNNIYIKKLKKPFIISAWQWNWVLVLEKNDVRYYYLYNSYRSARFDFLGIKEQFDFYFDQKPNFMLTNKITTCL